MRTSYISKNKPKEEPKKVEKTNHIEPEIEEWVKHRVYKAYLEIQEEVVRQRELDDYETLSKKISKESKSKKEPSKEEPKKKGKKWIIILICILIVGLDVVFYFYYSAISKKMASEDLEVQISKLYTSPKRSDIKDNVTQDTLNGYYTQAEKLKGKNSNITKIESELDTIGYFLQDKKKLNTYSDVSYDLSNTIMLEDITKIKDNTANYTVSGLAVTITEMSSDVLTAYNNYINLKTELESIRDVSNFDKDKYIKEVEGISHVPNKTEVTNIYNKLVADKQKSDAKKKLKRAKDSKARREAESALKDAENLQKKTQKELNKAKKRLKQQETESVEKSTEIQSEEVTEIE